MTDLVAKIITRFQGDATLYPTVSGLWLGKAPDLWAFPYGLLRVSAFKPIHFMPKGDDDLVVERTFARVVMYDTSLAMLSAYQTALHTRFDKCSLSLTAPLKFLSCERTGQRLFQSSMYSAAGLCVYHASSDYLLTWQNPI